MYIILYRNLIYCYAEEFYMKSDLQFKEDSKLIHKYLKAIRKKLPIYTKAEKLYLQRLSSPMYDFAESSGDKPITMEDLIERFGEPEDCAKVYIESLGTDIVTKSVKRRRCFVLALVLIFSLLIIVIGFSIGMHNRLKASQKQYIRTRTIFINENSEQPDNTPNIIERNED